MKKKFIFWINLYKFGDGFTEFIFRSKKDADKNEYMESYTDGGCDYVRIGKAEKVIIERVVPDKCNFIREE